MHALRVWGGRRKAEAAKVLLFPRSKDRPIRQARVRIVVRADPRFSARSSNLMLKTQGLSRDDLLFSSLYTRIFHATAAAAAAATTTTTTTTEKEEATTTLSVPRHVAIGEIRYMFV